MHLKYTLLLYILLITCLEELSGKNHFDADVYNNRFKVRRLIQFKLDLCKEIKKNPDDNITANDALKKYAK